MNNLNTAACGLDCSNCNLYKATFDESAAQTLVDWFLEEGWIEDSTAAAVMEKAPFCNGCWNDGGEHWCSDCNMLTCCKAKNLEHCAQCGNFPCDEVMAFAKDGLPHHKKAYERLASLHERNS